jgi:TolB-like protein
MIADRLLPEDVSATAETAVAISDDDIARNTIAVLPFADLSQAGDQQYFTDGLSEELLNLLVGVDGLKVASRTTAFGYRGTTLSIPEIAKALGVAHILEGSVRKSGDRIRITAQLIDAETDQHLWSENFDRNLDDIFAIQDEIGNAIVNALKGEMGLDDPVVVSVKAATDNVDAYAVYLEARELFIKRDNLAMSIRLFRQAIDLDPEFARAWEGLAAVEIVADDWLWSDGISHTPLAMEAAKTALELDPSLSMPFAVIGSYEREQNFDPIEAMRNYGIALQNDPKNTTALLWSGIGLDALGFFDDAIHYYERCLDVDPGYLNCQHFLAYTYLEKGMTDKALEIFEPTLEHNFHSLSDTFVPVYARNGQRNLALLLADIVFRLSSAPVVEWIRAIENPQADHSAGFARFRQWESETDAGFGLEYVAIVLLAYGEYEELASFPNAAGNYAWHPDARDFRSTQYFKNVVRETGALTYWRQRGFPNFCRPLGDDDFECDEWVQ